MIVHVTTVWPWHRPDKTLHYANVIVRDERGKKHFLITFDQFMATLCQQYERKSSTLETQPPAVDLIWDERGKILGLQEIAA